MKNIKIYTLIALLGLSGIIKAQEVRISTDREFYFPGDNILIEAQSIGNAPKFISENLYLLSESGKLQSAFQFQVKDGYGSAVFPVPFDLEEGYYQLSFKQNDGPLSRKAFYVGGNPATPKISYIDDVTIKAEGKSAVCGCNTKFAVKSNAFDSLKITDGLEEIAKLKTDALGYASFEFTPPHSLYELGFKVVNGVDTTEVFLPGILKKTGYCIKTNIDNAAQAVVVNITAADSLSNPGELSLSLSNGKFEATGNADLTNQRGTNVKFPFSILSDGLWKLKIVSDNTGKIHERSLFISFYNKKPMGIQLSKSNVGPREQLEVNIQKNFSGVVNGSLKVVSAAFVDPSSGYSKNIVSQGLIPESLIKEVPQIGYYLVNEEFIGMNDALIFFDGKVEMPEISGSYSTFATVDLSLKDTVNRPDMIAFYNPTTNVIFEAPIDKQDFDYKLYNIFSGKLKFYYQAYSEEGRKLETDVTTTLNAPKFLSLKPAIASGEAKKIVQSVSKVNQHYASYFPERKEVLAANVPLDFERDLNDFYKFETVEEAVMEVMPGLAMRTRRGKRVFRVFSDDENKFIEGGSPLFIVNGIPTFDQAKIKALDPKKFVKYGVAHTHTKRNLYGKMGRFGVVKLETTEIVTDMNPNYIELTGVLPYKVGEISFDSEDSSVPLFNPLVNYTPNVSFSEKAQDRVSLTVSHNDLVGEFYVIFEGTMEDGTPIHTMTKYNSSLEKTSE